MRYFVYIFPLLVGMGVILQSGANTQLREVLGNPYLAGLISFSVGLSVMLVINVALGTDPAALSWAKVQQTSWWMWLGGVMGACFIMSVILVAPRIGPTRFFCLIIASQLSFSLIVDHYGWFGFEARPVNIKRMVGVALLIVGALLAQLGED